MNSPMLKSVVRHIDHVTYAVNSYEEVDFINRWSVLGFSEIVRLTTKRFPATHIALTSGKTAGFPWAVMTGLSVSDDDNSPVNEFIRRYGQGVQHMAYSIDPGVDMVVLQNELLHLGSVFMTGVLTHTDTTGARLRQIFTAPNQPFGPFVELIQRVEGPEGDVFDGFDVNNIDDLYQAYNDHSSRLMGTSKNFNLDRHSREGRNPVSLPATN